MIGALLQMLRRVPVLSADGLLVGRELGGATVGLVGMTAGGAAAGRNCWVPSVRASVGYDPAVHVVRRPVGALEGRAAGPARADRADATWCACC